MTTQQNLVVYVRHAESEANIIIHKHKDKTKPLSSSQEMKINSFTDPNISELGYNQAHITARHLLDTIKKMGKTKITVWQSPFVRAQNTAKPFIEQCTENLINIQIVPELQEYTTTKIVLQDHETHLVNHTTKEEFYDQVIKFNGLLLEELGKQTPEHILIIFGHSLFFSTLITYHVQHEKCKILDIPSLQLPNCSISCETHDFINQKWKTFKVASISHLPRDIVTGSHELF